MIFLLHVEWPEMPPYKLLLPYYVWRIVWRHAVRSGNVSYYFYKRLFYFCHVFKRFFLIFIWMFSHLWLKIALRIAREFGMKSQLENPKWRKLPAKEHCPRFLAFRALLRPVHGRISGYCSDCGSQISGVVGVNWCWWNNDVIAVNKRFSVAESFTLESITMHMSMEYCLAVA